MNRKGLMIEIRNYIDKLPCNEQVCNGCQILKQNRVHGARGQQVTAFSEGTNVCEEHELIWAIHGSAVERPLECILNGQKYNAK